jgi:cell division protease FtsH
MGTVKQLPENDQLSLTLEQMKSRLAVMLGGRAAEEMTFGREKVTSGAATDFENATKLARNMVTRWGLSEELGTIAYGENQDEVFLGHSVARQHNVSDLDAQRITAEIRRLVDGALAEAKRILSEHRRELEVVADGLLKYESLSGQEILDLIAGRAPVREFDAEPQAAAPQPAAPDRETAAPPPPRAGETVGKRRTPRKANLEESV